MTAHPDSSPTAPFSVRAHGAALAAPTAAPALCRPAPGHYDELRGCLLPPSDALCPPWAAFFRDAGVAGPHDLDQKFQRLQRQLRDNGVTYNVYSDQEGPQRPWSLDLFPLIIDAASWAHIEAGVLQRMRLLEALLRDVYGAQHFLQQGLLPAALVHGHPGYLRGMAGVQPVGGRHLHVAAFDLARGPDGLWWLMGQRTQAPSGLGYLMENRRAVSAQFPQAFASLQVRRLGETYRALMESMRSSCPDPAQAHLALLTPGPYNETYFEHAYLARSLGLSLVEGSDLVVRDACLYLKTLRGLVRVHGLLKRVDDEYLDPLELRADSTLGVPGLLQAVRAGKVLLANAPGSAFLESPALLGFLPALAQAALGEELVLPAVPTWWCGEASVLESQLPQLARHTIQASYPGSLWHAAFESTMGYRMDATTRAEWGERIRQRPEEYTLQASMPVSHLPTWQPGGPEGGQMQSRASLLRVFVVADGQDAQGQPRWRVLPGGMARVAGAQVDISSMQRGGSSADVWALQEAPDHSPAAQAPAFPEAPPVPSGQGAPAAANVAPRRLVTSRAAENLFWLGRYTERAENAARLARVALQCLDAAEQVPQALLAWLVQTARSNSLIAWPQPAAAAAPGATDLPPAELEQQLLAHLGGPHSWGLGYSLQALRRCASGVRERLSQEHWALIERADQAFHAGLPTALSAPDAAHAAALRLLRECTDHLAAITGGQTDRMTRDDGWRLLSIGRHVERLAFLAQALELGLRSDSVQTVEGFDAMLALFDSTITFRAQYQQSRALPALAELLVRDRDNPRSLAWVTHSLRGRLAKLAGSPDGVLPELSLRLTAPADWEFALPGQPSRDLVQPLGLADLMQRLRGEVLALSQAVASHYFNHAPGSEVG